jgi:hypothetical protein
MTAPWTGRLSPVATGWVLALLFFGLALFILVPWKSKPEPEPTPAPYIKPPNKLAAYGLPNNPDLELLPEMFALHADQAPWSEDRVEFAYWHPGVKRFEYFFEASRINGTYRFKVLPEQDLSEYSDESKTWPIFFYTALISNESLHPDLRKPVEAEPKLPMKVDVEIEKEVISPPGPPSLINDVKK